MLTGLPLPFLASLAARAGPDAVSENDDGPHAADDARLSRRDLRNGRKGWELPVRKSIQAKSPAQVAHVDVRMLQPNAVRIYMPHRQLTTKQQLFLQELLANDGNAAAAYRVAFPDNCTVSSVSAAASRLRRDPRIVQALAAAEAASRQVVDAAVDRYRISAERVADELARLAFTRMPQLADVRTEIEPDGTQRQRDC